MRKGLSRTHRLPCHPTQGTPGEVPKQHTLWEQHSILHPPSKDATPPHMTAFPGPLSSQVWPPRALWLSLHLFLNSTHPSHLWKYFLLFRWCLRGFIYKTQQNKQVWVISPHLINGETEAQWPIQVSWRASSGLDTISKSFLTKSLPSPFLHLLFNSFLSVHEQSTMG